MFVQMALLAAQLWLGEVTRQRPKRTSFDEFQKDNQPSELRAIPYIGGTVQITPPRMWYGDFEQRAVERDSHWTDYIWAGALAGLLDFITVAYRSYVGEMFPLCWGPDANVEQIFINDRLMFQAIVGSDNAGGGFLIDDPQAWGGDQPPGEGGEYAFCKLTRGNYTDPTDSYIESLLSVPPNKTPSLRGISTLWKYGPSGFEESGYFHAGGVGVIPKFKEWKITVRRQPDNLATGFNKIGRHMNPIETIYEWSTSLEYGARSPVEELNLDNWRQIAEDLHTEGNGWSGKIEDATSPQAVVQDVLDQIDAIAEPHPRDGLTIRLIRRNYVFLDLRTLDQSSITRVERFTTGTYEDTKNKVNVEFPDQDNNFKGKKALYIDIANQIIQGGRTVPQSQTLLGVADFDQANTIATADGRALGLPRASLDCFVKPSFGRLTTRGEVVVFQWSSPSFEIVMRVMALTPNGPEQEDYHLVLVEDQFATGLRTFGETVGTAHEDPGAGLDTPPPSAAIDSLTLDLVLTNTNQFVPTIIGQVSFGAYLGGQLGRIYVTEPGGAQTLSPIRIAPDANGEAQFTWPANAVGEYEFCVQTFSWRGATNGVKVCDTIDIANIGSPSLSPSSSVSPSPSPSISPSASESPSTSPSLSPSGSQSPSASVSLSPSASASVSPSISPSPSLSPSASVSPSSSVSASTSPSSSASPSGAASDFQVVFMAAAEHESDADLKWPLSSGVVLASGVTGAFGRVYDNAGAGDINLVSLGANYQHITVGFRVRFRVIPTSGTFARLSDNGTFAQVLRVTSGGVLRVGRNNSQDLQTTAAGTLVIDTWYTFMWRTLIADSGGEWEVRLIPDGGSSSTPLSGTGDTRSDATSGEFANEVALGDAAADTYCDEAWVEVTGGIPPYCRVETLAPTGAGGLTQLTRGGADSGANWSQVDDHPANGDTDYVVSTGANQFDSYAFANRSVAGTPLAVQVCAEVKFASAGTREVRLGFRIGGSNFQGATHTITAAYTVIRDVFDNNPATGNAWTDSDIDGAEVLLEGVTTDCRITNVAIEVLVQV